MPTNQILTTRLILDFESLKNFGYAGLENGHIDISPFSFFSISHYASAWKHCRDIMVLQANSVMRWELEVLGRDISAFTIDKIKLTFTLLGYKPAGTPADMREVWNEIFNVPKTAVIVGESLVVALDNRALLENGVFNLALLLTTAETIERENSITYSISLKLTETATNNDYYIKIDPLIKNNSNGEP